MTRVQDIVYSQVTRIEDIVQFRDDSEEATCYIVHIPVERVKNKMHSPLTRVQYMLSPQWPV